MNPRPPARKALDFGVRDHDSAADLEEADLALRGHLVDTRPRNAELRRSVFDPPRGWSDATGSERLAASHLRLDVHHDKRSLLKEDRSPLSLFVRLVKVILVRCGELK
jgi:hypothetical protein